MAPGPELLALVLLTVQIGTNGNTAPADEHAQAKHERLARVRAGLVELHERATIELSARLLSTLSELLEKSSEREFAFEDWSLRRKHVEAYCTWYGPDPEREGRSAAIDVESAGHPIHAIAAYAQQLAAQGIDLLVVPVPARLQVYPDRIPGIGLDGTFHGIGPDYAEQLIAMTDAGIEIVDLLSVFAAEREARGEQTDRRLFLDHDHHWTPRGIALAAERIAERIRELPWYEPGPDEEGRDFRIELRAGIARTAAHRTAAGVAAKRARKERVWFRAVERIEDVAVPVEATVASKVLVIGDSFVGAHMKEKSDVARHLYARLGSNVDVIYNPGAGTRVWQTVARRGDELLDKKVVVWIFHSLALVESPKRIELFERR